MTERHRVCKNCEHFCGHHHSSQCRKKIYAMTEYGSAKFPRIDPNDWCGDWLPKSYNDNPAIKAAWDEFVTLHILAMEHD